MLRLEREEALLLIHVEELQWNSSWMVRKRVIGRRDNSNQNNNAGAKYKSESVSGGISNLLYRLAPIVWTRKNS